MEKILELLEEYGAVSKDMSASHGDQRNWRIQLAEAIYKQNAAEQGVHTDEAPECDCNSAFGFHEISCAQSRYYAALRG